jgi:hypothetical protein
VRYYEIDAYFYENGGFVCCIVRIKLRIVPVSHALIRAGFGGHRVPLRGDIVYGDLIFDDKSIWLSRHSPPGLDWPLRVESRHSHD